MQKQQANFKTFIVFWLSQTVSQLGSAMTGYALVLWVYGQTWADEQCAFRIAADPLLLCALCAGECVCRRVCRSSPQKEHHALRRYRCVPVYAFNCGAFAAEPAQCTVDLSG